MASGWTVYYGDGRRNFTPYQATASNLALVSLVAVADFNHDGFADLAGWAGGSGVQPSGLLVWLGSSTQGSFTEWGVEYPVGWGGVGTEGSDYHTASLRADSGPDLIFADTSDVGVLPNACASR